MLQVASDFGRVTHTSLLETVLLRLTLDVGNVVGLRLLLGDGHLLGQSAVWNLLALI